ncbi:aminodeoxychorismate synthase component I [Geodermatophilus sp. SYSU D00700]
MRAEGRFDDLAGGTALSFPATSRVLVATTPDDVVPVLAEVERETAGGCWAFGYLAYEAATGLDPGLTVAPRPAGDPLPLAVFGLTDRPLEVPVVVPSDGPGHAVGGWTRCWTEAGHRAAVERVREHIAAGDTYQLNLTVRMCAPVSGDLRRLYADLAWAQAGRHAAFLDLGRHAVLSASPELFFRWSGEELLTRPMKGTAPRGATPAEDEAARARLLASDKERAENLMIVDLLRNDLGRVAEVGSVEVPALFTAERYETVWQLTSDVTARTRPGTGLVDVLRALFPSGSVTGAPKRRSMELVAELEDGPRGVYCGAVGWVAPPGSPDRAVFSVAIRTVTVDRATGTAEYGTGGGITWSSDPAAEHAELLAKAAILDRRPAPFALLETMAAGADGAVRDLDRHLARLARSAAELGFPFPETTIRRELAAAAGPGPAARLRLALHADGRVDAGTHPLPAPPAGPVRLAVDGEPVDPASPWLRHKTTRRDVYTAAAARHPDADDVVLTNTAGHVTETTIANLAVRLDGAWWTPPLSAGLLPGVARGRLVEEGRLRERDLTPDDLRRAEALAVVSSLRGWRPAVLV